MHQMLLGMIQTGVQQQCVLGIQCRTDGHRQLVPRRGTGICQARARVCQGEAVFLAGFLKPTRAEPDIVALKQHHLTSSPDRLTRPQKRVGDTWTDISWEQALSEIGAKVAALRKDHAASSTAPARRCSRAIRISSRAS